MGEWGNNDTIKRSVIRSHCPLNKEVISEIQIWISRSLAYHDEVIEGEMGEKCTTSKGKWRKGYRGLLYHNGPLYCNKKQIQHSVLFIWMCILFAKFKVSS